VYVRGRGGELTVRGCGQPGGDRVDRRLVEYGDRLQDV
jgi:hypothetical protein